MNSSVGTRVLERPDGANVLLLRSSSLAVIEGPSRGRTIALERPITTIGSGPDSDVVLADDTVSGRHAELVFSEQGLLLRDLGSKNGTFVDGLRVREAWLARPAELALGSTRMRFSISDDEVEIPVSRATNFGELLGHSPVMRAAFSVLERVAKTDTTVLLLGESGTGKELAAHALHTRSRRAEGPYQVFDCGAASPSLIESQLFGHSRGAFTGAVAARAGVFEEADGGTLFLDEIGELPLELQPKLLRALESRSVQRVGESAARAIDVRFVAATHRNLEEEVRAGRFRQDLYFRLAVVTVRMPALRERKEEIPRLVSHFVSRIAAADRPDVPRELLAIAVAYDWPGNVRELRNFAERFLALGTLDPRTLLPGAAQEAETKVESATWALDLPFHEAKQRWTDELERVYLARLFGLHKGNISEAARVAGLSRQSCYRLMKKHGLGGDE